MLDSHFNTTVHLMITLAYKKEEDLSSKSLAETIGTNPAFIRKIMAKLSRAGLIETKRGQSGGVCIARPAKEISLKDIYLAVHERIDGRPIKVSNENCPVSCSMQSILLKISSKLEKTHLLILGRIKLSHLTKDIK